jgi:hypothetical protein
MGRRNDHTRKDIKEMAIKAEETIIQEKILKKWQLKPD